MKIRVETEYGIAERKTDLPYRFVAVNQMKGYRDRIRFSFHFDFRAAQKGYGRAWEVVQIVEIKGEV